jgi:ankyrin repeat protein
MAELGFELSEATRHDGVGMLLAATPLHNAAWMGDVAMVRLLLELGADPSVRDPSYQATPLGWAEYNQQAETAALLRAVSPAG